MDSQKRSKEKDEATSVVYFESEPENCQYDIDKINERFESLFASASDRRRLLEDFDPTQSYYGLYLLAQQKQSQIRDYLALTSQECKELEEQCASVDRQLEAMQDSDLNSALKHIDLSPSKSSMQVSMPGAPLESKSH